jgi:hypothetical protein
MKQSKTTQFKSINTQIKSNIMSTHKGIRGSIAANSGKLYEEEIHALFQDTHFRINSTKIIPFNTQTVKELGCHDGASQHDITCNVTSPNSRDLGLEIKKANANDWVHVHLSYDKESGKIVCPNDTPVRAIFNTLLTGVTIFGGKVPDFLSTGTKWSKEEFFAKKKGFVQAKIPIPDDTISKVYESKGCQYIQISGQGLFSTGIDIYGLGVPQFKCKQYLTVYIKNHGARGNSNKLTLSVSAAFCPLDMMTLRTVNSPFSFDNPAKFPNKLVYTKPFHSTGYVSSTSVASTVTVASKPTLMSSITPSSVKTTATFTKEATNEAVIAALKEKIRQMMS